MGASIKSQVRDVRRRGCDSDGLWEAGSAAFPQPLENPSGFPQTHSLAFHASANFAGEFLIRPCQR